MAIVVVDVVVVTVVVLALKEDIVWNHYYCTSKWLTLSLSNIRLYSYSKSEAYLVTSVV